MTMLDHGILRTAMTFSSTASCVAVAPRTRWVYCTSGETSGRCIRRIAAFRMLLAETVTFGARFGFNTFVIGTPPALGFRPLPQPPVRLSSILLRFRRQQDRQFRHRCVE